MAGLFTESLSADSTRRGRMLRVRTLTGVTALLLAGWFLYFAGPGIRADFTHDDMMNLAGYLHKPLYAWVGDCFRFWSTAYRPMAAVFYLPIYYVAGFNPLPFRVVSFALLLLNLYLLACFARTLTRSRETACFAAFLASYHAWFIDLYWSSGTIYDVLCFSFYVGAFLWYASVRERNALPNRRQLTILVALYIFALDSKEMAVTLPLFVFCYEALFHWPSAAWKRPFRWLRGAGLYTALTAAVTLIYISGKLTGPGSLVENPAYRPAVSAGRFLDTFHLYLNPFLYQQHVFKDSNTVQLLLAMLVIALLLRSRRAVFAWLFLLLSELPVSFIPHYSAFFLYLPMVGWAMYGGILLTELRRLLYALISSQFGSSEVMLRVTQAATLAALLLFLAPRHQRETRKTLATFLHAQPPTRLLAQQFRRLQPRLPRGAKVLFVNVPVVYDPYDVFYLAEVLYDDPTLRLDRTTSADATPALFDRYFAVFAFDGWHVTKIR